MATKGKKNKKIVTGKIARQADASVIVIANLLPREMKFGTSDGMVLATSQEDEIVLIKPEKDVNPGAKIS